MARPRNLRDSPGGSAWDPTNSGRAESPPPPPQIIVQPPSAAESAPAHDNGGALAHIFGDAGINSQTLDLATDEVTAVAYNGRHGLSAAQSQGYSDRWSAMGTSRISQVEVNQRQLQAIQYYERQGWTRNQAIGIVSNLTAESSMRIDLPGDGGQAYGLAQWHPDRRARFSSLFGHDMRDTSVPVDQRFREQLEFVHYEMTGTRVAIVPGQRFTGTESRAGELLRQTETPSQAAGVVSAYYERPADRAGNIANRGEHANGLAASTERRAGSVAAATPPEPPNDPDRAGLRLASLRVLAPAAGQANQPLFLGDSIADGVRSAGNGRGDTLEGRSSAAVLGVIRSQLEQNQNALRGETVVLSSGASNSPGDLASVREQVRLLNSAGARVVLLGAGSRSDLAHVNRELATIASTGGATFMPLANVSGDGVHPTGDGYRQMSRTISGAMTAAAPPAPSAPRRAEPVAGV